MSKYVYDGPVMEFETLLTNHWHGETIAPTKKKARSNLTYQFKKSNHKIPSAKITLTGDIQEIV